MTMVRQRGSVYPVKGAWGIRWREDGSRRFESGFSTKTAARDWYADTVLPRLRGEVDGPDRGDITLEAFVDVFLSAHAANVSTRTIDTLTVRLRPAKATFGGVTLADFEKMAAEIAAWRSTLPERARYGYTSALRQVLDAAIAWGRMTTNPAKLAGKNPQPKRLDVVPLTLEDVDGIAAELGPTYGPLCVFAAETGLRPGEWAALERRDIDVNAMKVERAVSNGTVNGYLKTARSRRRVPLSDRALAALKATPRRIDTPYLFPGQSGGPIDLHNFRSREWIPAVKAAGVSPRPRIYDLRHTFASNALAGGVSTFELSRMMGTSLELLDKVYGHLVRGSEDAMRAKLNAFAEAAVSSNGRRMGVD